MMPTLIVRKDIDNIQMKRQFKNICATKIINMKANKLMEKCIRIIENMFTFVKQQQGFYYLIWYMYDFLNIIGSRKQGLLSKCTNY